MYMNLPIVYEFKLTHVQALATYMVQLVSTFTHMCTVYLLNQAHTSLQPACAWFLKIDPVRIISMRVHMCACVCVCVCVCLRPRLLITSDVI